MRRHVLVAMAFVVCGAWPCAVSAQDAGSRPSLTRNKERKQVERQGDYIVDDQGRRLRVSFPFYDRAWMGGQAALLPDEQRLLSGRVGLSKSLALDFADEDVWWMMRHRILDTTYAGEGLRTTLVRGDYLRHDLNSFVIVPTANDLRLPANFDIAADYQVGHLELTRQGEDWELQRLGVAQMSLLMDFIRDEDYRHRFAIGLSGWYHVQAGGDEAWRHEVSTLTSAKVLYGWDQRDGRFRAFTSATCGAAVAFQRGEGAAQQWAWSCRGRAELEWVVMAISDHPVSIPLEVQARVPFAELSASHVEATLGLRMSFSRQ